MDIEQIRAAAKARKLASERRKATQQPQTGMVEQTMSGVNEGIAGILGMPVDMAAAAINGAFSKRYAPEMQAGPDGIPTPQPDAQITQGNLITNPIGGSQSIKDVMGSAISDVEPQSMAQRYGRRVGQELGASAVPGGVAMRAASKPMQVMGGTAASATGSAIAGQTSREIAPENDTADFLASLVGGGSIPMGMYAGSKKPKGTDIDDLRVQQSQAYGAVDASKSRLTPESMASLTEAIQARSARDAMDPILSPKAHRTAEKIQGLQEPTIAEVEKMRRLAGRVAGSADETERALGQGMKNEITSYLDGLKPENVTGGDPEGVVKALREGRSATRRIKKYEAITDALMKGERRAASSGTGGNVQNAIRQNIRAILDNRKKRAGFTADEIKKMEEVVQGTATTNTLRTIGKLSPTTGALQGMMGGGAFTAGIATSNPAWFAPPVAGFAAKAGAEAITGSQIDQLTQLILNGAPLEPKRMSDAQRRVLAAMMAGQASGAGTQ